MKQDAPEFIEYGIDCYHCGKPSGNLLQRNAKTVVDPNGERIKLHMWCNKCDKVFFHLHPVWFVPGRLDYIKIEIVV